MVILDNGRTGIMNSKYRDMMRCIKCGACLNHCPVYGATGGHAYGWVYPGPMGSVLTPLMQGLDQAKPLPNASSFCGRCAEVCPMGIPLPELLRQLRNDQGSARINSFPERRLLALHGWLLTRPRLYQAGMQVGLTLLNLIRRSGWITTRLRQRYHRRIPPPASRQTFMKQWKQHRHGER